VSTSPRFSHTLAYQWCKNGSTISGASASAYTISSAATGDAGTYSVVITCTDSGYSSIHVESSPATLTVGPPVIINQPWSQSVFAGQTATFSVTAEGNNLAYQWSFNGASVTGATGATYSVQPQSTSDSGTYQVKITSCNSFVTSDPALLSVFTAEPPGYFSSMTHWWPGEGNATDIIGSAQTSVQGTVGYSVGEVGQAFCFYGNGSSGGAPSSVTATVETIGLGDFSLEFWIKATGQDKEEVICQEYETPILEVQMVKGCLQVNLYDLGNQYNASFSSASSQPINDGVFHHIVITRKATLCSIYIDGALSGGSDTGGVANLSQNSDTGISIVFGSGIGVWNAAHPSDLSSFVGQLDEITMYSRALTANEVAVAYSEGEGGLGKLPRLPRVVFNVGQPWEQEYGDYSEDVVFGVPGDPNAIIFYTTDDSMPTLNSAVYTSDIVLPDISDVGFGTFPPTVFKAIAIDSCRSGKIV
jgi:hypothetical protein